MRVKVSMREHLKSEGIRKAISTSKTTKIIASKKNFMQKGV